MENAEPLVYDVGYDVGHGGNRNSGDQRVEIELRYQQGNQQAKADACGDGGKQAKGGD